MQFLGRDFTIGRRLGGGNFGTVFEARVLQSGADKIRLRGKRNGSEKRRVVLKRIVTDEEELRKNFARKTFFGTSLVGGTVARGNFETGKIESYFNERVRRYGFSGSFAQYLGAFVGGIRMKEDEAATVTLSAGQWLVWSYEGERTVDDYLSEDEFPYNIESAVLNKKNEVIAQLFRFLIPFCVYFYDCQFLFCCIGRALASMFLVSDFVFACTTFLFFQRSGRDLNHARFCSYLHRVFPRICMS